ncbi:hypothetical protein [Hymenobacter norwichensis]|uniref:hypothetical protein n=1 Tax=Hymenobacter norwichensis TaxID=223903 RepID=UPI0003B4FF48|nr:hypothetical protein [Hymenobacter norwichensis]
MIYFPLQAALCLSLLFRSADVSFPTGKAIELSFEYLEACETGAKECQPVLINRKKGEQVTLALPAMNRASVGLWDAENYQRLQLRKFPYKAVEQQGSGNDTKALVFDLSKREDGIYYLWLTSCGVGGTYEVRLKTEVQLWILASRSC